MVKEFDGLTYAQAREIVRRHFAWVDYLENVDKQLGLPETGKRAPGDPAMTLHTKVILAVKRRILLGEFAEMLKVRIESEGGLGFACHGRTKMPDFIISYNGSNLYGEVGDFSFQDYFSCYRSKRLLWVSKSSSWDKKVSYLVEGQMTVMNFEACLRRFIEEVN